MKPHDSDARDATAGPHLTCAQEGQVAPARKRYQRDTHPVRATGAPSCLAVSRRTAPCVRVPVDPRTTDHLHGSEVPRKRKPRSRRESRATPGPSIWSRRLNVNQRLLAPQRCLPRTRRLPPAAPSRSGSELRSRRISLSAHGAHPPYRVSREMGRMGRGELSFSEVAIAVLEHFGHEMAEAIERGEFHRARALTEQAIGIRAGEPISACRDRPTSSRVGGGSRDPWAACVGRCPRREATPGAGSSYACPSSPRRARCARTRPRVPTFSSGRRMAAAIRRVRRAS